MSGRPQRVLRISHSGVVWAWRERERELCRRGVETRLLCAAAWDEGGSLVTFAAEGDRFAQPVRTFGTHPNLFLYDPRPIWRALGDGSWDVIDIHEEPFSLAAAQVLLLRGLRRVRTPFVLYSAQNIAKRYPIPFRWIERWTLHRAAGVSVCNSAAGRILRRKGLRGVVAEIPLGVDVEHFSPRERAAPQGALRVGYVGRLAAHKGVRTLVDVLAELPQCELVLVGSGPDESALRARAQRTGVLDRVEFRGHVAGDALAETYREFDVLAVPSLTTPGWVEQFGRVVIEAMASGVPVVASRSGALPDVVGSAGRLAEPDAVDSWVAALEELSQDQNLWLQLRERGLARAQQFTWGAVADGMQNLYREARAGRGADAAVPTDPEVIVVAYGSPDPLAHALAPIAGQLPVTVVDNSSSPQTRALADRLGVRYLDPGRNLGFGAGVNFALTHRLEPDRDLLLLNPDATISLGAVRQLARALAENPQLACVGPAQVDPTGIPAQVTWPFPSPWLAWLDAVGLSRFARARGFVIGSVLLVRAEAIEQVGGFDERFFLYAEETDWQRRATRSGWAVQEIQDVVATHEGAGTGGDRTLRELHFHASHERYMRKHYGASGWAVYRSAAIVAAAARSARRDEGARAAARLRLSLYLHGPVRRLERADLDPDASR